MTKLLQDLLLDDILFQEPISSTYTLFNLSDNDIKNIQVIHKDFIDFGGIWVTGPNYPVDIRLSAASGSPNACRVSGGYPSTGYSNTIYELRGSTWVNTGLTLNSARIYHMSIGTAANHLICGGMISNTTMLNDCYHYQFNAPPVTLSSMSQAKGLTAIIGNVNSTWVSAGLIVYSPLTATNISEKYIKLSNIWQTVINYPISTEGLFSGGHINAGIMAGGVMSGTNVYKLVNGLSFVATSSMLVSLGIAFNAGVQNSFIVSAGSRLLGSTQIFNGLGWRIGSDAPFSLSSTCSVGSSNFAISVGGYLNSSIPRHNKTLYYYGKLRITPKLYYVSDFDIYETTQLNNIQSNSMVTLEYRIQPDQYGQNELNDLYEHDTGLTFISKTLNNLLYGTFASPIVGTIKYARLLNQDTVDENIGLLPYIQTYNNNTWSLTGYLNVARTFSGATGHANSFISIGGSTTTFWDSITNTNIVEYGNQSTMSILPNFPVIIGYFGFCGVVNAGLINGGYINNIISNTTYFVYKSLYRSTSFNSNVAAFGQSIIGKINAAFKVAGESDTGTKFVITEKFNGTSWAISHNINAARLGFALSGNINSALLSNGYPSVSTQNAINEYYNGNTWMVIGSHIYSLSILDGDGTSSALIFAGGNDGSVYNSIKAGSLEQSFPVSALNSSIYVLLDKPIS